MVGEPYNFSLVIKRAREHCGLSLSEAAKLIRISKQHLWQLEQGQSRNPTIVVLAGLACTFDLSLGTLAELAASSAPGTDYRATVVKFVDARKRLALVDVKLPKSDIG